MAFLTFVLVKYVPCELVACMYSMKAVMFRVTIRQDMQHTYIRLYVKGMINFLQLIKKVDG